jgi:hypothetical protein
MVVMSVPEGANCGKALYSRLKRRRFSAAGSLDERTRAWAARQASHFVAHAFATSDAPLFALRTLAGVASVATFVGDGLLATRLSARAPHPGLVIGLYYGGAGQASWRRRRSCWHSAPCSARASDGSRRAETTDGGRSRRP